MMKKLVFPVVVSIASMANFAFAADLEDPCDPSAELQTEMVDEVEYYKIGTCGDLYKFAEMAKTAPSINGKLTADICLNACEDGTGPVLEQIANLGEDGDFESLGFNLWTPIGSKSIPYKGVFDGANHYVRGLYANASSSTYVGFFGFIDGGTIRNLGVKDSYFVGNIYVAGVVAWSKGGFISDVYNEGSVSGQSMVGGVIGVSKNETGGTVRNLRNSGIVTGNVNTCAGVVASVTGAANAVVKGLFNEGHVNGESIVGGVVGLLSSAEIDSAYNKGSVDGNTIVGGVVGNNSSGSIVRNSYNLGSVSGTSDCVGGVAGESIGSNKTLSEIVNCYNEGLVSGSYDVGGIVGRNSKSVIRNVYNVGDVYGGPIVGGIVGTNTDKVSYAYNAGVVFSISNNVGNIVGMNIDGVFDNTYYNSETDDYKAAGSDVESEDIDGVSAVTMSEFERAELPEGFDTEIWVGGSGEQPVANLGRMVHKLWGFKNVGSQPEIAYKEFLPNSEGFYEIGNAQQLKWFADMVNSGGITNNAKLIADICLNACGETDKPLLQQIENLGENGDISTLGFEQWNPLEFYLGVFDGMDDEGNIHTISGLYFDDSTMNKVGFIAYLGVSGKVENVGLVDSYVRGNKYVGGLVGTNYHGSIANAYNAATVIGKDEYVGGVVADNQNGELENLYNVGMIRGEGNVGGVAGYMTGKMDNCYNAGSVSASYFVGGVIGASDANHVDAVYNIGIVKGSSITVVDYKGGEYNSVGAVIGYNHGTISHAYYNKEITCDYCEEIVGVGKTAAELFAGETLEGFDTLIWGLGAKGENVERDTLYYPYLKTLGPGISVIGDVKKYTISVVVNDDAMGAVTGAGEYEYGTTVDISAVANEGYKFIDWKDAVKDATRSIKVTKNETFTANFEEIPSSSSIAESSSSEKPKDSSSSAKSSSSSKVSSSSAKMSSSSKAKSSSSAKAKSSSSSKSKSSSSSKDKNAVVAVNLAPQFSVAVSGREVSIIGARLNTDVHVFDMQGNRVKTQTVTSSNFSFALPNAGTYILKSGYTVKRVNVK